MTAASPQSTKKKTGKLDGWNPNNGSLEVGSSFFNWVIFYFPAVNFQGCMSCFKKSNTQLGAFLGYTNPSIK